MSTPKTALVLGATGLVGGEVIKLLLADETYQKVSVLVRRNLPLRHAKLEQHMVDFDQLSLHAGLFAVDDVYCCLGTTIRKAGSQEAFRKVDYTYPCEAARLALAQGVKQYLLVTALGADPKSGIFYNRVKGEVEAAIGQLGLYAFHIFRPSMLLGDRPEVRVGEQIGKVVVQAVGFLLIGSLKKYKGIHVTTVARAMRNVARKDTTGKHIYESDRIQVLGR